MNIFKGVFLGGGVSGFKCSLRAQIGPPAPNFGGNGNHENPSKSFGRYLMKRPLYVQNKVACVRLNLQEPVRKYEDG